MSLKTVDGELFLQMIKTGAARLAAHKEEINALNVFPIPDGDTGDNMLQTVNGGLTYVLGAERCGGIGEAAGLVSRGMLLSARGNSGVILSQFFEGLARGLAELECAEAGQLESAFFEGVKRAYEAVMNPAEGTMLTVMREASAYACGVGTEDCEELLAAFVSEARRSLARTPELLAVLKSAGVVDSGGAGLLRITEGMLSAMRGESAEAVADVDFSSVADATEAETRGFTEDSVLELGYCTEVLLRLQRSKVSIEDFDERMMGERLGELGESVAVVRSGSLLKLHVHTFTPHRVLELCQSFGEFLKVKIENMSLQHGNMLSAEKSGDDAVILVENAENGAAERKRLGVLAVACGDGVKRMLYELGADAVIDGGQGANPSVEDIALGIRRVNAETVFILPNNGNVLLAARQAAELCGDVDARVVETRDLGGGYAALSVYSDSYGDADEVYRGMCEAAGDAVTAQISQCVRDTVNEDGMALRIGDYIGFTGKKLLACGRERGRVLCRVADRLELSEREVALIIVGESATAEDTAMLESHIRENYRGIELYTVDGGQAVYDYIIVAD